MLAEKVLEAKTEGPSANDIRNLIEAGKFVKPSSCVIRDLLDNK